MNKRSSARLILSLVCLCATATIASAQGGATSSISGTVKDAAGGVVPGATVVVKNIATGTTYESASNTEGVFSVPALDPGVYSVTVSLEGFKTAVVSDVRIVPGTPASVDAVLEVGQLSETITIQSSSELVNTQTPTIASTLNVDQVNRMPMTTRNALNAVTYLPGVNTPGVNRDATINGLPQSFINITLDGVSNNDNFNKSTDGFFAMVTPKQDAIEAVTVTTGVGGADVGGHGAVAINFVTRSGTNKFSGSAYEYYRGPDLNTNSWTNERNNLPKNDITLNQYGLRQGGPIVLPKLYDGRGKAFFFVNYEELRLPNNVSRTRRVLHPRAQEGWFRYETSAGNIREVNVLDVAARNGHLSSIDPTIAKLFAMINTGTQDPVGTLSTTNNPMVNNYVWQSAGDQTERGPVIKIDYNLGDRHRLSGTWNQIWVVRDPDHLNNADLRFPNSVNYRKFTSTRPSRSITLRSTLSSNLVNELRGGITRGGFSYFGRPETNGPQTFADQGGFAINFDPDENIDLANWWTSNTPTWRSAYQYTLDETLSWQRGRHSFTFGGSAFLGRVIDAGQTMVPGISLGFNTTQDPANAFFTSTNFPDASAGNLTDARQLYAILTGRVTAVTGQAALTSAGRYEAFAPRERRGKMDEYSLFAQDSWRLSPTVTLNAGVRWDVQLPFRPINDVLTRATMEDVCGITGLGNGSLYNKCNFFSGATNGKPVVEYQLLGKGSNGWNTDWNNVAPNVGIAWRPNVQGGWLRALLGDPEQATLRAGYSIAYERQGFGVFTGQFGANPGSTLSLTRNVATGLGQGADAPWPVLLRQPERLYNATFPETPTFPLVARANRADSIDAFAPDIVIASARSWTVSFQRSITRDTAIDVRYVGTRGVDQWSELNYNTIRGENLINNGFYDEFRLAQANLSANNAAGGSRAGSFAYFGPQSGTNPLPIYLAYLVGRTDATNPAAYTGGTNTWTNSTLAQRLVRTNPNPVSAASDLDGTLARRQNAATAGIRGNFFVPNPAAGNVNVYDSGASSDYHALQLEVRRRLSRGLQVNGSYQYAHESGSSFHGFTYGRVLIPTNDTLRHAFKAQWDWTIPVGRGQRFGSNLHPILEGIVGGWQFNGVARHQARMVDFGNVRLVGMTKEDVQKLYKHDVRIDPASGLPVAYLMPDDIILNTRRAFSVSTTSASGYNEAGLGIPEGRYFAPASGPDCIQLRPGQCSPQTLMIRAPFFTRVDIGVTKRFPIRGAMNFELKVDVINLFDNINFNQSNTPGTGSGIFQTTGHYSDISNTFDPNGRLGQISVRFNW